MLKALCPTFISVAVIKIPLTKSILREKGLLELIIQVAVHYGNEVTRAGTCDPWSHHIRRMLLPTSDWACHLSCLNEGTPSQTYPQANPV